MRLPSLIIVGLLTVNQVALARPDEPPKCAVNVVPLRKTRGYAKLVAAMVGTAAATTYLSMNLPPSLQFLSIFVSQVTAFGVYGLGAAILEPVRSRVWQKSFVVRQEGTTASGSIVPVWEDQWWRTQERLSLNAQMSRSVSIQFVVSVQPNFFEAFRAIRDKNQDYAVELLASAAYRMRTWYGEVTPDDPIVTEVIRAAFTHGARPDDAFRERVRARIAEKDADGATYYAILLDAWFGDAP